MMKAKGKAVELEADFLAGMMMADIKQVSIFGIPGGRTPEVKFQKMSLQNAGSFVSLFGDAGGSSDDHGSDRERVAAFIDGWNTIVPPIQLRSGAEALRLACQRIKCNSGWPAVRSR